MEQATSSKRFGKLASNFANSEVHKTSPAINLIKKTLNIKNKISVCDVGCGTGHTALAFTKEASHLVGVDPAPEMLHAFKKLASDRGVDVVVNKSFSESIDIQNNSFDLVITRLASHHFINIQKSIAEMHRITKPDGYLAIIDLEGSEDDEIDEFNHALEILHDPTHVRSYKPSVWKSMVEATGMDVVAFFPRQKEAPNGVPIKRWCEIAASGSLAEQKIRDLLSSAPQTYLDELMIKKRSNEFFIPVKVTVLLAKKGA